MKKAPLNSLFLCIFALATPIFANFTPADSAKAKSYCQGNFWGATVYVENPIEASDKAMIEIAKRIKSAVEAQANLSSSKNMTASGKIENVGSYLTASQINSNLTISGFQSLESPKKFDNGTYEFKGYVCNKDIASPYHNEQRALKESMERAERTRDWNEFQSHWNEFNNIQTILNVLRVDSKYLAAAEKIYKNFKALCNIKLHWKPERKTAYSEIAYQKLRDTGIESPPCSGKSIMLVYSGAEPECKSNGGPYGCSYQPSLRIASCKGNDTLGFLGNPTSIKSFGEKKENAIEKMQDKLRAADFWNEWKEEIKERSPQCE
jgi:hypothetical protein